MAWSIPGAILAAAFAFSCSTPAAPLPQDLAPPCQSPAPLYGTFDPRAPDYLVVFPDTVAAPQETARLAAKYDFTPTHVYETALEGFSATLTPRVVADLRCEQSVAYIEHDQVSARP